jgi:hypothetical protein
MLDQLRPRMPGVAVEPRQGGAQVLAVWSAGALAVIAAVDLTQRAALRRSSLSAADVYADSGLRLWRRAGAPAA